MSDKIEDLEIQDENSVPLDTLNYLKTIFHKKKVENIKEEKKGIFKSVIIGGILATLLALPIFNKFIQSLGCTSILLQIIVNFIIFCVLYAIIRKKFNI